MKEWMKKHKKKLIITLIVAASAFVPVLKPLIPILEGTIPADQELVHEQK